MTSYCLDTNACIDALRGRAPALQRRILAVSPDQVMLPSLVMAELLYGVKRSSDPLRARAKVEAFTAPFAIVDFDAHAAIHYAEIRQALESRGTPIGANDLIIAATVRSLGSTLVTHNTREFSRVDGLLLEDWLID